MSSSIRAMRPSTHGFAWAPPGDWPQRFGAPLIIVILLLAPVCLGPQFAVWKDLIETGDSAANALLIAQWKEAGIGLHGNYSRIGFYHPGPFILAFGVVGELLFFDLTGIVSTPMAAQALGFELYNAVFLIGIYVCWASVASHRTALAAVVILIAAARVISPDMLGSSWFPRLYGPAFAAFLVAAATIVTGRRIGLPVFALAGVALVHGHVAFVLIVALFTGLVAGLLLIGRVRLENASTYWIAAGAIVAIGVAPIVASLVFTFPGEIGAYLNYGERTHNGIGPVQALWVLGVSLFASPLQTLAWAPTLIMLLQRKPEDRAFLHTCLVVGAVAVFGSFLYLAALADAPKEYLVYYLSWLPLVIGAFSLAVMLARLGPWTLPAMALVATIAGVVADRGYFYFQTTRAASTMAARDALLKASHGKIVRLKVDLRPNDWAPNWSSVTALLLLDAREGQYVICVDPSGWHPSFSRARNCDAAAFRGKPSVAFVPASGAMPPPFREAARDDFTRYWAY